MPWLGAGSRSSLVLPTIEEAPPSFCGWTWAPSCVSIQHMPSESALLLAPAQRAPDRRGVRARAATIVTVIGVLVLLLTQLRGTANGIGGTNGWSYQYSFHTGELGAVRWLVVSAALFLCGSAALRVARTRGLVALAALLLLGAVGVLVLALSASGTRRLSQRMYLSVPRGETESSVAERFGAPASTDASAVRVGSRRWLGCLVYTTQSPGPTPYLFCFSDGRLGFKSGG